MLRTHEIIEAIALHQLPDGYEFNEPESIDEANERIDNIKRMVGEVVSQLSWFNRLPDAQRESSRARRWRNARVREQKLFELDLVLLKDWVKGKNLYTVQDRESGDWREAVRLSNRLLRAEKAKLTNPDDPVCLLRALHHHIIEAEVACGKEILEGDGKDVKDMVGNFLRRLDSITT